MSRRKQEETRRRRFLPHLKEGVSAPKIDERQEGTKALKAWIATGEASSQ
jgi:hypothetical protein